MAEVALRAEDLPLANTFLNRLEAHPDQDASIPTQARVRYLLQDGQFVKCIDLAQTILAVTPEDTKTVGFLEDAKRQMQEAIVKFESSGQ